GPDAARNVISNGRPDLMNAPKLLLLALPFGWACSDPPTSSRTINASLAAVAAPEEAVLAGQLLAFASTRDQGAFQVFVMQENALRPRQLTTVPNYNARPNWSHDGRRITFTACRPTDQSCEIYVMNADGSGQTKVTDNFSTEQ